MGGPCKKCRVDAAGIGDEQAASVTEGLAQAREFRIGLDQGIHNSIVVKE
jgi:hypothetical protein